MHLLALEIKLIIVQQSTTYRQKYIVYIRFVLCVTSILFKGLCKRTLLFMQEKALHHEYLYRVFLKLHVCVSLINIKIKVPGSGNASFTHQPPFCIFCQITFISRMLRPIMLKLGMMQFSLKYGVITKLCLNFNFFFKWQLFKVFKLT